MMLTDRQNRLQIESPQVVECLKSWDRLQLGLPEIVVTEARLDVMDEEDEPDAGRAEEEDLDVEMR
jgi:hypothetical protein